jgi:outer membrane protein insertion porin family
MGGAGQLGAGVQFVLGLSAKSGFVFGDAGPFYQDLYALGGVQYGIPLRGYDEFSITPNGFDPKSVQRVTYATRNSPANVVAASIATR